jgi:hypothetical protein
MTKEYRNFRCIECFVFSQSSIAVYKLYDVINFRGLLLNEKNEYENDDKMILKKAYF